ncbi:MAG TPA: NAD(P)-dependent oxidoreductase [Kiritimatiellia bacterium]|nr:NAD(P)-dependent oxidoreductase [Kiritimatiellia bacterium]
MQKLWFVTGAAGFIGRHVCVELLRRGDIVAGVGRLSNSGVPPRGLAAWSAGAVNREALRDLAAHVGAPDAVLHLAGGGTVGDSIARPREDYRENVGTVAEVLEFARGCASAPVVVLASSGAVYGRVDSDCIPEDTPLSPVSPYGLHKWMAEELCRTYGRTHAIPVAVVRFFSVLGPGLRKQLLWDAARRVERGEPVFDGTGEEVRDWLHVSDAVRLLCIAAEHASSGCPVINGGAGRGVRVADMLDMFGACGDPRWQPRFTGSVRPYDPPRYVADIRRARAWGFEPRVDLQDAVAEYARWFRAGGVA